MQPAPDLPSEAFHGIPDHSRLSAGRPSTDTLMATLQSHVVNLHSASPGAPLVPIKRRACDRCRQRKSRCDGGNTCAVCRKADVPCSYLSASKKRGPRTRVPGERKAPLRPAPPAPIRGALQQPEPQDNQRKCGQNPLPQSQQLNPFHDVPDTNSTYFSDILAFGEAAVDNNASSEVPEYPSVLDMLGDAHPLNASDCHMPQKSPLGTLSGSVVDSTGGDFSSHAIPIPALAAEASDASPFALPRAAFAPYIALFFLRLYPIFPVLDKELLQSKFQSRGGGEESMTFSEYALVTALSAMVIVQLNIHDTASLVQALSSSNPTTEQAMPVINTEIEAYAAEYFVSQCLVARESGGFIESPDEKTVMSSFFLFGYFGGIDRPKSAWYYLREAIGFALLLSLDDEDSYSEMSGVVSQRRRRIFWLLFVTERAFALQHRSGVMLRASPALPNIFTSEDPKLIYGFVHLVNIYKKIDETFITAWKTQIMPASIPTGSSHASQTLKTWLTEFQRDFDHPRALAMLEMDETQRLDILVTQSWVRMLVWQLGLRRGLLRNESPTNPSVDLADIDIISSRYPLRISQELLGVVSNAERGPLEAHGIGMEQKVFDVACTLSDVLRFSSDWGSETHSLGREFLHGFMNLLARFRNQESQYLKPLLAKASDVLDAAIPQFLPTTEEAENVAGTDDLLNLE